MWIASNPDSAERGVSVDSSVVGSNSTDEIFVRMLNLTDSLKIINPGACIAQAIVIYCDRSLVPTEVAALPPP